MSNKRKAGEKLEELYGGTEEYGSWGDTWNHDSKQQQLKASGSYSADSELAKKFSTLKQDGRSRVDDEGGWRELVFDEEAKSAGSYADLVNKWSAAGFDVRAIDMDKGFAHSNIAVRRSKGAGTGVENPVSEPPPVSDGGGGDNDTPIIVEPPDDEISIPEIPDTPVADTPKSFLAQYIKNSFNARGGNLTNTGDITAGGDIKLDNSVTNSNKVNQVASNGYRLDLGELKL